MLDSANYTISGPFLLATATSEFTDHNINVSYTVAFNGVAEENTEAVIANLTSGATAFFSFSNVWFILTAITILIGIVLGVIALVNKSSGTGNFSS